MVKGLLHASAGLLCLALAGPINAQVFHDDFDGSSLDPARWLVAGGGTVVVAEGRATLSAGCGETFPYVTSVSNPFPTTGDFLLRVGFRYPNPQAGGNGFGATDTWNNPYPLRAFGVWQDFCCGGLRAYYADGLPVFLANAPETSYRVFEWQYLGGAYFLFVDGEFRGGGASEFRPIGFFFGHPPYAYCPWTTQEIDFVHIEPITPTGTERAAWGGMKARYR